MSKNAGNRGEFSLAPRSGERVGVRGQRDETSRNRGLLFNWLSMRSFLLRLLSQLGFEYVPPMSGTNFVKDPLELLNYSICDQSVNLPPEVKGRIGH